MAGQVQPPRVLHEDALDARLHHPAVLLADRRELLEAVGEDDDALRLRRGGLSESQDGLLHGGPRLARELLEANTERVLRLLVEGGVVLELEHQAGAVGVEADLLQLHVRVGHEVPHTADVTRLLIRVLAFRHRRFAVEHVRHDAQHVGDRHGRVAVEPLLEVDVHAVRRQVA